MNSVKTSAIASTREELASASLRRFIGQLTNLLKLRIGIVMMLTALVAMMVTPGPALTPFEVLVLAWAVLAAAGSAGAYNQYYEVEIDRKSARTCNRPFVTGYFRHGPLWLLGMLGLLLAGILPAALWLNPWPAIYIFLGAFFYAVVYTVWLKRRSWTNIVIGGASGSFAVLAGAAAVDPSIDPVALQLAVVLFLWTPSHFWSLAIAKHKDYARSEVPMLPVIIGDKRCAQAVLLNTLALVAISLLPFFYGLGWIYLLAAAGGGGFFIYHNLRMLRDPSPRIAMQSFFASLLQLVLLLLGAVADVLLLN